MERKNTAHTISIRPASDADTPFIIEGFRSLFALHDGVRPTVYPAHIATLPEGEYWVAVSNTEAQVGFLRGSVHDDTAAIHDVYVEKAERNQGVGSLLVDVWVNYAKRKGCTRMLVTVDVRNKDAVAFWRASHFDDFQLRLFRAL